MAFMLAGGIWFCRWRELRPMAFGTGDAAAAGKGANGAVRGEYELVGSEGAEDARGRERI